MLNLQRLQKREECIIAGELFNFAVKRVCACCSSVLLFHATYIKIIRYTPLNVLSKRLADEIEFMFI